jgi:hypothetical protein
VALPEHKQDQRRLARHQQADLSVIEQGGSVGYELAGVPYGFAPLPGELPDSVALALQHAQALGLTDLEAHLPEDWAGNLPVGLRLTARPELPLEKASLAAALATALIHLRDELPLTEHDLAALRWASAPEPVAEALICTDGSADKQTGALSVGYTLGGVPYGLLLAEAGHESIAEREAIRLALQHAQALGHRAFRVRSDHLFHVRRYDENLIHRGRRKSESLERLDDLIGSLGTQVRFEYAATLDTDAPHRFALHARALLNLSRGQWPSRAQMVALRRVHHALKGGGLLF